MTQDDSDSRLSAFRERFADPDDETDDETSPSSWFGALRQWFNDGSLREAARERAGRLVIRVSRTARVPYEVASDPRIHCTAKYTKTGTYGVENDDSHDQRNYDPDRFDDPEPPAVSVDRSGRRRRGAAMSLYRVLYGSFDDTEAGEIVDLTPAAADFLGDQVERAPNASASDIDISEVAAAAGLEVEVGDVADVKAIEDSYGPSSPTNDIDVRMVEESYNTDKLVIQGDRLQIPESTHRRYEAPTTVAGRLSVAGRLTSTNTSGDEQQ